MCKDWTLRVATDLDETMRQGNLVGTPAKTIQAATFDRKEIEHSALEENKFQMQSRNSIGDGKWRRTSGGGHQTTCHLWSKYPWLFVVPSVQVGRCGYKVRWIEKRQTSSLKVRIELRRRDSRWAKNKLVAVPLASSKAHKVERKKSDPSKHTGRLKQSSIETVKQDATVDMEKLVRLKTLVRKVNAFEDIKNLFPGWITNYHESKFNSTVLCRSIETEFQVGHLNGTSGFWDARGWTRAMYRTRMIPRWWQHQTP